MNFHKFPRISMNFKSKSRAFTPHLLRINYHLFGRSQSLKGAGFTLVEALIAIFVLTVGILSGFILITRVLYSTVVIQDRLTASFLAQEGIELVRQIRDSNFLRILNEESITWKDNLADGRYIIEAKAGSPESIKLVPITTEKGPNLKYNDSLKIYNYASGEETSFNREIKITTINDNEIRVEGIMNWKSKQISFSLVVEEHLFNWLKLKNE